MLLSVAGLAAGFLLITGYERLTSGLVLLGAAASIVVSLRGRRTR